jgi:hypothetical protein
MFVWVLADVQLSSETGTVGVASPVVDSVLSAAEVEGAGVVCAAEPQPDASMAIPATVANSACRFPRAIPKGYAIVRLVGTEVLAAVGMAGKQAKSPIRLRGGWVSCALPQSAS